MTNEIEPDSECKHRWLIDSPNGPTSKGVCQACGEKGEFKNSIPISGWDRVGAQKKQPPKEQKT